MSVPSTEFDVIHKTIFFFCICVLQKAFDTFSRLQGVIASTLNTSYK